MHSPSSIAWVGIHVLSLRYVNRGCFTDLLASIAIGNVHVLFIGVVNSIRIWVAHVVIGPILSTHVVLTFTSSTMSNVDTIIGVNIVTVFHIIHPFFHLVTGFPFKFKSLLVVHEGFSVSPSYCTNDVFFTNV